MTSLLFSERDTITVVGATGHAGSSFTLLLRKAPYLPAAISKIVAITHHPLRSQPNETDRNHLKSIVTDDIAGEIPPNTQIVFSEIRAGQLTDVGGIEDQYKIGHDLNLNIAKAALDQGVLTFVIVSSSRASIDSPFAYSRMNAETERDVVRLGFDRTVILRPGLIVSHKKDKSALEIQLQLLLGITKYIPLMGWWVSRKTCSGREIAKATLMILKKTAGEKCVLVLSNWDIRKLAREFDIQHEC
ncbi:uncharacterized protein V2V93DRAFT_362042 [Kockiozyma suomiensis]|uniref:uncharacterized protein n=1 Tax=Kockiozyma suomiensis TaxID=1337062 RepID=UPI0033436012